jgi:hypothetical protein
MQVLDHTADSYWVVLPPDGYGTRRVGWIEATDVAVEGQDPAAAAVDDAAAAKPAGTRKNRRKSGDADASASAAKSQTNGGAVPQHRTWFGQNGGAVDRRYARAATGFTFGSTDANLALAGTIAVATHNGSHAFVEGGYLRSVLPGATADAISTVGSLTGGLPLSTVDASAATFYGEGGVSLDVPTAGTMRPYVSAGGGVAFIGTEVKLAGLAVDQQRFVRPMMDLGTGFTVPVGNLRFDVGYNYKHLFDGSAAFNINQLHAGIRWAF